MQIRGALGFLVSTPQSAPEVRVAMRRALNDFQRTHSMVLSATVNVVREGRAIHVALVLRSSSYGDAEDVMTELAPVLAATSSSACIVERGATELVPA